MGSYLDLAGRQPSTAALELDRRCVLRSHGVSVLGTLHSNDPGDGGPRLVRSKAGRDRSQDPEKRGCATLWRMPFEPPMKVGYPVMLRVAYALGGSGVWSVC